MDSENVQTVVELYFTSLQDRRNRHLITQKYANLAEASGADIESDAGCWFSGFAAAVKLIDPKSKLPPVEMVLGGIVKSFETETAA
jgi:hypothetical protein